MTDENYTHLLLIVDRSGSMQGIHEDMNGGIATLLFDQDEEPGTLLVDAWRFDTTIEKVADNTEPNDPALINLVEPRGGTALYDGIGTAVYDLGQHLAALPEERRPSKVVVMIVTDGDENSSREWNLVSIKTLVEQQREQYGWQFVFLGANIDSFGVGGSFGIPQASTMNWEASSAGVASAMSANSISLRNYRNGGTQAFTYDEVPEIEVPD